MKEDYTLDIFFNGKLKVYQKKRGYRFAIDAFIIANFVQLKKGQIVVELGTGCGIIALLLALKYPEVKKIIAIEIQSSLALLARKNVSLNRFDNLIEVMEVDMKKLPQIFPAASCDVVVSNPPYYSLKKGRISPEIEKAIARHEIKASLEDIVKIGQFVLKEKGKLYLIYPASRCQHLFITLRSHGLEPKCLRFVHPYVSEEANFVMVEAMKGGKEGLKVKFPLIIYERHGKYTPEVAGYYKKEGG